MTPKMYVCQQTALSTTLAKAVPEIKQSSLFGSISNYIFYGSFTVKTPLITTVERKEGDKWIRNGGIEEELCTFENNINRQYVAVKTDEAGSVVACAKFTKESNGLYLMDIIAAPGNGGDLIEYLADLCEDNKINSIRLEVADGGEADAKAKLITFYTRHKFVHETPGSSKMHRTI